MKKPTMKNVLGTAFFFGVMALTLWYVFHDENLSQVHAYLQDVEIGYVLLAVGAVIAFILGESVVICYLLRALGTRPAFSHCCLYSFVGFFYSAITPSASGGQPMQVVAMRRDGISVAVSTVVLAIVTLTYKMVLIVVGFGVLVFRPAGVMMYLDEVEPLIYLGLGLNVVFVGFLLLAVFHPGVIRGGGRLLFRAANGIHPFHSPEKVTERMENIIRQYSGAAAFFQKNTRIIVRVFLITFLQRFFFFGVVWFTFQAFGLTGQSPLTMMLLYAMISVAVDMLPLPGGMGVSETLFLAIFEPIFGEALVLPGMIVCRGISYYTQLLVSGVMTGVSQFVIRNKDEKNQAAE